MKLLSRKLCTDSIPPFVLKLYIISVEWKMQQDMLIGKFGIIASRQKSSCAHALFSLRDMNFLPLKGGGFFCPTFLLLDGGGFSYPSFPLFDGGGFFYIYFLPLDGGGLRRGC
jgi:hypothetical protein